MIPKVSSSSGMALAMFTAFLVVPAFAAPALDNSKPLQVIDANGIVVGRLNGESVVTVISGETSN